jgi:hypothetical protein
MNITLNPQILALLAVLVIASLGIGAAGDAARISEPELAVQGPEMEHVGCQFGHPLAPCSFDAYPAGDLFIVEPSFG